VKQGKRMKNQDPTRRLYKAVQNYILGIVFCRSRFEFPGGEK